MSNSIEVINLTKHYKSKVAVKNIINGFEPDNKESLVNPESLSYYRNIKELSI